MRRRATVTIVLRRTAGPAPTMLILGGRTPVRPDHGASGAEPLHVPVSHRTTGPGRVGRAGPDRPARRRTRNETWGNPTVLDMSWVPILVCALKHQQISI